MRKPVDRTLLAALAALGLSAGLAGWSILGALQVDASPAEVPPGGGLRLPPLAAKPAPDRAYLTVAVESAPFDPERRRPQGRYRLPGEAALATAAEPQPGYAGEVRPAAAPVKLVGTMLLPQGRSVALIQTAGESARLVHVGESVGELTLTSVGKGSAVFTAADGTRVELEVQKAGS